MRTRCSHRPPTASKKQISLKTVTDDKKEKLERIRGKEAKLESSFGGVHEVVSGRVPLSFYLRLLCNHTQGDKADE
jgi:hypothetical protein